MTDPLTVTAARLAEVAEHLAITTEPQGDGWLDLVDLPTSPVLDDLVAVTVEREGRGDVAGSYVGSYVSTPVVGRTAAAMVLADRCPDPTTARLHLHPDGWFDEIAFPAATWAVLADDPAAGLPGTTTLADRAELHTWWAERVVAVLAPALAAVRTRLPYGNRGLWGGLADRIGGAGTFIDRSTGGDGRAGWTRAQQILDALAAAAPVAITRPRELSVPWSGGTATFSGKGTCCLWYLVNDGCDRTTGEGYCTTCPLVDETAQLARLAAAAESTGT